MTQPCILLVGAGSRAAQAWRDANPGNRIILARKPLAVTSNEQMYVVSDYFAPDPALLRQADVVINFTGVARGPLMAVNSEGPQRLARLARAAGVRQFIHISSLSVYGGASDIMRETPEQPSTDYGHSKLAADRALQALAVQGFAVTLLRVPTLYDANNGKVCKLVRLLSRLPLFPAPTRLESRAILHFQNLALALNLVIAHALEGIHFAADPELLQLDRLAFLVGASMGRPVRLLPLPKAFFGLMAIVLPSLYTSLYTRSVIDPALCLPLPGAVTLSQAVAEILARAYESTL